MALAQEGPWIQVILTGFDKPVSSGPVPTLGILKAQPAWWVSQQDSALVEVGMCACCSLCVQGREVGGARLDAFLENTDQPWGGRRDELCARPCLSYLVLHEFEFRPHFLERRRKK